MGLRTKLKEARAAAALMLLNGGATYEDAGVPEIPVEWTAFPGKNDMWKRIDFPKDQNTTFCLYMGYSGSVFPPHRHPKQMEHFTILNKGGKVEVITESSMVTVEFPNSVFIPKGEPHAVRFLTDTKLIVMWHPIMEDGWEAQFAQETEINVTPAV